MLRNQWNQAVVLLLSIRHQEGSDVVQAKMAASTSITSCLKKMPSRMILECMLLRGEF